MSESGIVGRHLIGVMTTKVIEREGERRWLVWRNVYQMRDGTRYEAPGTLCKNFAECSPEELEAAKSLPPYVDPEHEPR